MRKRIYILLFAVSMSLIYSCEEMIKIPEPSTEVTANRIFSDSTLALQATLNLYASLGTFETNFISRVALYTGEVTSTSTSSLYADFINNNLQTDNSYVLNVWRALYNVIYQANAALEGLSTASAFSDQLRNRLIGESRFIRAYCYFYLVNIFGDVPLILDTSVDQTAIAPREKSGTIYTQITDDLEQAIELLSVYPDEEKTRADKMAANALLSRVFLYLEDWEQALFYATEVINSEYLDELPPLEDVFIKNGDEAILQLWRESGYSHLSAMVPPSSESSVPTILLPPQFIDSFDEGDMRKNLWTGTRAIDENIYAYPAKYKLRGTTTGNSAEYTMLLRLAEQYLIRAEANIRLNNYDAATGDLNVIRNRAGLPDIVLTGDQLQGMNQVAIERERELFTENGLHFFDLKRWQTINEVMPKRKPNWQEFMALYPIPRTERDKNPLLTQNFGY
ncbi:RagB/SusD family nutrient uptake outer membrane protein [Sinomicrobium kalidii]|uniref:RagB/SusD family nutrient uptake outer membrane protein n=1 Tax=Sinomicrobium kalidii TaxID=2900738 RepID=UPI001E45E30D|nr:RagB/SusD family nutrient uptake outer membrane protein [Sinomicrobium kalidii]UGU18104.1 RagB/SusD family nutrient uptake outer membrane protein [Sinomicrobium kalidii]